MKLQSLTRILLTLLVVTMCVSSVKGMEYDTDRGGLDYKSFDLTKADPALCQTSCSGEAQCKAWTYVKPGIQGAKARCWLKTSEPAAKPDACCVSGVKDPTPTPIQDFQVKCCGDSMSWAKVCVSATLKNFTSLAVDYSTKYIGLKSGQCVKYDDNHCKHKQPGVICIPPCVQISPPTPVTTSGPSVSVPAKSSKTVLIKAPNHAYVMGSVLEVQSADGTLWRALVTPIDSCVN